MKQLLCVLLLFTLAFPGTVLAGAGTPHNLLVTVLQTADMDAVRALLSPGTGTDRLPATVYGNRRFPGNDSTRQLRVLEGHTAFIHVGHTEPEVRLLWVEADADYPLPNIDFLNRERASGLSISAELAGDRITLQVQYFDQASPATQNLATRVSGRIGQWLDLGGSLVPEEVPAGVTTYSIANDHHGRMRILVKVELAE
jgi:hypothetical protein